MALDFKKVISLTKETFQDWLKDEPFDLSAMVAYYAIFSLPALLIIITSIASAVLGKEAVDGKISGEIGNMIGPDAASGIQEMIANAHTGGNSVMATIIGVVTLLFGSTGVFIALQKSLNRVWEITPDPKKGGFKALLMDRATSFGIILAIGFLLLISLVLTAMLTALSDWIQARFPDILVIILHIINFVLSFGVITVMFAVLFKYLPDVKIEWRSVWIGAAVTAFLFVLGKFGIGFYFGKANPGDTYGAAGSVILILLWVSYSCLIMFFGAEFTQVYARHQGYSIEPNEGAIRSADYYENRKANNKSSKFKKEATPQS